MARLAGVFLQLLALQQARDASGATSCLDPRNSNYRCGSSTIFLTHCGLTDADFPEVAKCFDSTTGGRSAITHVFFVENAVTAFPDTIFQGCESIQVIVIHDNRHLATLPGNMLKELRSLELMSIARTGLTQLHAGFFSDQQGSLVALYLTDNRHLFFPERLLRGLRSLKRLTISFTTPARPHEGMFSDLESLNHLTLLSDQLTQYPLSSPWEMENLLSLKIALPGDERDDVHCVPPAVKPMAGTMPRGHINVGMSTRESGKCGVWEVLGEGAVLRVLGEPKSGTTLLASTVTALAVRLCGTSANRWCRLTSLEAIKNVPSTRYVFNMLHAGTGTLFLRFEGQQKHTIPGLGTPPQMCARGGRGHVDAFETAAPCTDNQPPTRERLLACLPDTIAPLCDGYFQSLGPSAQRMIVVVRDPRNVVISEYRMRQNVYGQHVGDLDAFIKIRFEVIVAWMHQRWVWHTTALKESSHVVFLEDLHASHIGLIDLAAVMGLACTPDQALQTWRSLWKPPPHGEHLTHGLQTNTLLWMDQTMSRLLPEQMLDRWGLATS